MAPAGTAGPVPVVASAQGAPLQGREPLLPQGGQSIEPNPSLAPQGKMKRKHVRNLVLSVESCSLDFLC